MRTLDDQLRPSGAYRWMNCPGSAAAEAEHPKSSSVYASEGTAAHSLAERCLRDNIEEAITELGEIIEVEGIPFTVDLDMTSAVQKYLDAVRAQPGDLLVEAELHFDGLLPKPGKADSLKIDWPNKTVYVNDYKHGRGVPVSVANNPQLKLYALGTKDLVDQLGEVEFYEPHIMQPRAGVMEGCTISAAELEIFRTEVEAAVIAARAADAPRVAGDWCRFCDAKAHCAALARFNHETIATQYDEAFEAAYMRDPNSLDLDALSNILKRSTMISDWLSALWGRAMGEANAGNTVPGYKLVKGRAGNRKFNDDEAVKKTAKSMRIKADLYNPRSLVSPTEMLKIVGDDEKFAAKFSAYITRSEGKPTLVPDDDKRPKLAVENSFTDLTVDDPLS